MSDVMRVLVVDDEPQARQRLVRLLRPHEDIDPVACSSGIEAVRQLTHDELHGVFLDMEMPDLHGLEVVERVGADRMPPVVFVTAYSQHAIRAFEINALDYILKPFDAGRLTVAIDRLRLARADVPGLQRKLDKLLSTVSGLTGRATDRPGFVERLFVRTAKGRQFVSVEQIMWIEARGNYCKIHTEAGVSYLHRVFIGELERRLDPAHFARIHRSTIVRLDAVMALRPEGSGDQTIELRDGTRLRMSRTYYLRPGGRDAIRTVDLTP